MKKKGKKKLLSIVTAAAMLLTVFNIPLLGYATQTAGSTEEPVSASLNGWDVAVGDHVEGGYTTVTTDGITVKDLYDGELDYGDGPYHVFEITYDDSTEENESAVPEGTITIKSSNPDVAKITTYKQPEYEIPVESQKAEASIPVSDEGYTTQYFDIFYIGKGSSTITMTHKAPDGTVTEVAEFPVVVNAVEPDYGITIWNEKTEKEEEITELKGNLHDYIYSEDAYEVLSFSDLAHPKFQPENLTWETGDADIAEPVYSEGETYCYIYFNNVGSTELTAAFTDNKGNKHSVTIDVIVVDYGIRASSYYDEDDPDYWWGVIDEDYTDTDSNMYLGAFTSTNERFEDVEWSSDNTDVAKVGRKGRVYPLGVGSANITAKIYLADGNFVTTEFKLNVYDPDTSGKLKYVLDKGTTDSDEDNTAIVYRAKSGWDGVIPATIKKRGTTYKVVALMDRFYSDYDKDPITVTLGKNIEDIGSAFQWNDSIKYINVTTDNKNFESVDGVLFNEDKTTIIAYPAGMTKSSYSIPAGTKDAAVDAFTSDFIDRIYVPSSMNFSKTDEGALNNSNATFIFTADNKNGLLYAVANNLYYEVKLSKIAKFAVKSYGTTSLTLNWSHDGVNTDGYEIYQYIPDSGYEYLDSVESKTYTVKGLKAGGSYKFMVKAYGQLDIPNGEESVTCAFTSEDSKTELSAPTAPGKMSISKLTTGKKYIKASWKKANCTGYQLYVSTNSKFTKGLKKYTIKSSKTLSKKVTKLKKGTKYYVKVRAYKTYGGKTVYGAWSSTKSIKCK